MGVYRIFVEHGRKAHGSPGFGPIFIFYFLSLFIRMIRAICVLFFIRALCLWQIWADLFSGNSLPALSQPLQIFQRPLSE